MAIQHLETNTNYLQEEEQIILQKGKDLDINLDQKFEHYQVRVHTSLGRLVKRFADVNTKVSISTKDWKEGIYIVVIKSGDYRNIKRVLLTK